MSNTKKVIENFEEEAGVQLISGSICSFKIVPTDPIPLKKLVSFPITVETAIKEWAKTDKRVVYFAIGRRQDLLHSSRPCYLVLVKFDKDSGDRPERAALDRVAALNEKISIDGNDFERRSTLVGGGSINYAAKFLQKVSEVLFLDRRGVSSIKGEELIALDQSKEAPEIKTLEHHLSEMMRCVRRESQEKEEEMKNFMKQNFSDTDMKIESAVEEFGSKMSTQNQDFYGKFNQTTQIQNSLETKMTLSFEKMNELINQNMKKSEDQFSTTQKTISDNSNRNLQDITNLQKDLNDSKRLSGQRYQIIGQRFLSAENKLTQNIQFLTTGFSRFTTQIAELEFQINKNKNLTSQIALLNQEMNQAKNSKDCLASRINEITDTLKNLQEYIDDLRKRMNADLKKTHINLEDFKSTARINFNKSNFIHESNHDDLCQIITSMYETFKAAYKNFENYQFDAESQRFLLKAQLNQTTQKLEELLFDLNRN
jgi:hypothetical protein